jgi:hypothetical protein
MFLFLNRLRGTYGWFASVFGACIVIAVYLATKNIQLALLLGVGYWFGEMICGWGDHVGVLSVHRWKKFKVFPKDGDAVGARWLTSVITHPRLWRMHLENAKNGLWNIYPRTMNLSIKGYSLARLFKVSVQMREIKEFDISNAMTYARVFLVIRGLYWWIIPMIGVSLWVGSFTVGAVALVVLSFGWPLCAELGYRFSGKISFHKFGLDYDGGWELQEGFKGALIDLVIIAIIGVSYAW